MWKWMLQAASLFLKCVGGSTPKQIMNMNLFRPLSLHALFRTHFFRMDLLLKIWCLHLLHYVGGRLVSIGSFFLLYKGSTKALQMLYKGSTQVTNPHPTEGPDLPLATAATRDPCAAWARRHGQGIARLSERRIRRRASGHGNPLQSGLAPAAI